MKAAVLREYNAPLTIEDVDLAEPGPGEIRVKTAACAICHSDIHFFEGAWPEPLPAVYGHEAAGVVEAVGEGVKNVSVGDHVVVTLIRSCGTCHYCSRGAQVVCDTVFPLDRNSPLTSSNGDTFTHGLGTGAFAEYMVVDQSQVVSIPKDIPFDSASLLACGVITGFGAVTNTAQIEPGSNVVVIGTGGVGLNAVQGAALAGASRVIAMDISESKLEAARAFGATDTINATDNDASKQVRALTAGRKAGLCLCQRRVQVGDRAVIQIPRAVRNSSARGNSGDWRYSRNRSRHDRVHRTKNHRIENGFVPHTNRYSDAG